MDLGPPYLGKMEWPSWSITRCLLIGHWRLWHSGWLPPASTTSKQSREGSQELVDAAHRRKERLQYHALSISCRRWAVTLFKPWTKDARFKIKTYLNALHRILRLADASGTFVHSDLPLILFEFDGVHHAGVSRPAKEALLWFRTEVQHSELKWRAACTDYSTGP